MKYVTDLVSCWECSLSLAVPFPSAACGRDGVRSLAFFVGVAVASASRDMGVVILGSLPKKEWHSRLSSRSLFVCRLPLNRRNSNGRLNVLAL